MDGTTPDRSYGSQPGHPDASAAAEPPDTDAPDADAPDVGAVVAGAPDAHPLDTGALVAGPPEADAPDADAPDPDAMDAAVLDRLEGDLEAVDRAMASLDEISADPDLGGDEAAAQIEAVASTPRFVTTDH